ncbi:phage tail fiber domain-containing protein, partial [Serratia sp. IR-2025]
MSVPNQTPYNIYTANGLTTVFPYEFYLLNAGDLAVSLNGSVITSGYTISGVGNVDGGEVLFLTPPANGVTVMLERVIPTYRLTDYQDNGDLLADTVNKDFDRLWMAIQQAFIYLGLALTRPLLGGPFNAKGYRIENLGYPVNNADAASKEYVDNTVGAATDRLFKRTLRVPEDYVDELPTIHGRGGKLFAWSNSGRPIAVHAETDGGTQLEIDLAGSDGFKFIGQAGSFDELRSVIPERAGQKILLGGYYPGWAAIGQPAGGGEFVAVSGVAVDDGGYICQPTGSALFHWQRVIDGRMLSPEMFGAFPDSTRSVRGTDYAANLNKMFAAAIANNFGVDFRHGQGGYEFEKERAYYVGSPVVATGIHQIRGSVYLHADSSLFDKTNNSYVLLLGDPKTNYQTIQNTLLFDFIFVRDIDQRGLRSGLKNELNGVFLKYTGVYGDGFRAMDFNGRGVHCSPVFDSKFGIIQERCGNELSYAITVDGNGDESNSITFTYILSHDAYHKGVYITGSKHNILRAHIEATAVTTLDDGYTGASGSVAQSGLKYLNNFFYLVAGQTGNITINDYSRSDNKTYYD